jgi:L-2,4-diaminobutyrate decarboxylase
MFIPSSAGICLIKSREDLKNCFKDAYAPYLYNNKNDRFDLGKMSIQCTRRGDALKIWGSLLAYGTDFFADRIEHLNRVSQYFYDRIMQHADLEALNKPEFNILCFRFNPGDSFEEEKKNKLNAKIREYVNSSGNAMITLTNLKGITSLRTTIINPATNNEHIDKLINILEEAYFAIIADL